jgi:hypothetical protein
MLDTAASLPQFIRACTLVGLDADALYNATYITVVGGNGEHHTDINCPHYQPGPPDPVRHWLARNGPNGPTCDCVPVLPRPTNRIWLTGLHHRLIENAVTLLDAHTEPTSPSRHLYDTLRNVARAERDISSADTDTDTSGARELARTIVSGALQHLTSHHAAVDRALDNRPRTALHTLSRTHTADLTHTDVDTTTELLTTRYNDRAAATDDEHVIAANDWPEHGPYTRPCTDTDHLPSWLAEQIRHHWATTLHTTTRAWAENIWTTSQQLDSCHPRYVRRPTGGPRSAATLRNAILDSCSLFDEPVLIMSAACAYLIDGDWNPTDPTQITSSSAAVGADDDTSNVARTAGQLLIEGASFPDAIITAQHLHQHSDTRPHT